ncbi:short chain enoyl-CoA hydratase [Breoghania corrubedonensis]|uniref:Short chain enoyl-CoA hydratase n=1 Tax=Breoghania corrubedonensis TaxID=665038 RepID=A0A2T5VHG2_9HYPH|nr:enoyl-CoA hydratase-related protein [Breoghania corrubedonensis]PTW63187.1 short chain enoyl-CoA hydratase [Breoghania corrubedonensis]
MSDAPMPCPESTPCLVIERPIDGIALVRLDRPQVRNALNLELRRSLAATFETLGRAEDVRCIVITGDDRAFCAGADLNEYVDATPADIIARNMDILWGAIANCPRPVVAAVRGYALGGGCELAMHADIILAGRSAKFSQPEILIGLIPGGGATQRLTRAVGKFAAMQLLLTGDMIGAEEAKAIGLVSRVVDDEAVLDEALKLASRIASQSSLAVRQIKEMVLESMNVPLEAGLRSERKAFQLIFSTSEKTKRIQAFLKRKSPEKQ